MYFTLMKTNEKRYVMFDNHTCHTLYDGDLLAREARSFRSHYSCMEAQGFLVLSPSKDGKTDFTAVYYSYRGCREDLGLDEAVCALEFARSLEIPFESGVFSAGNTLVRYDTEQSLQKTALHIAATLPDPLVPSFFRYGTENLCYYSLNLPHPHGVIFLEHPGIFHSTELLFLAKTLASDPSRFPQGGDISFIESARGDCLEILTYIQKEDLLSRSSSEGAVACAMVHYGLHPETETLRVLSSPEEKILRFFRKGTSPLVSFCSNACCISKGTVLEKELFCG